MQISACTIVLLLFTYFSIIYLYTRLDQVLALNFGFKENLSTVTVRTLRARTFFTFSRSLTTGNGTRKMFQSFKVYSYNIQKVVDPRGIFTYIYYMTE